MNIWTGNRWYLPTGQKKTEKSLPIAAHNALISEETVDQKKAATWKTAG